MNVVESTKLALESIWANRLRSFLTLLGVIIGIVAVTLAGIPLGVTHIPEGSAIASLPPSLDPILWKFDFSKVFSFEMLVIVFTFLFVDMFDTVGTLVGVSSKANMLDAKGRIPRVKEAFLADAIGTTAGAILGTSTVTTYVESAAGVAEGGRTGLTSLTVAFLFLVSLFFAPLFLLVPAAATAPALVLVGFFMMSPVMKIDFENIEDAFPAFVTLIMMPLTYSIAHGIVFGMLAYVLVKVCTGKFRDVSPMMAVLAILFAIKLYLG
jgi:AGZA family xanthine/uracil permease-like MFS transporter